MTRPIEVNIPHSLAKEEARRRIAEGFGGLSQQMAGGMGALLSFQQRWEGDRLEFEGGALGQKVRGRLDVLANSVRLSVDLPDLLASIADRIKGALLKEGQKLLEAKKS